MLKFHYAVQFASVNVYNSVAVAICAERKEKIADVKNLAKEPNVGFVCVSFLFIYNFLFNLFAECCIRWTL